MIDEIVSRFLNSKEQLATWPSKATNKEAVVGFLSTKFVEDKIYSEKEVNEILNKWHTFVDWPLLRRELVDRGYLARETGGYKYWKTKKSSS